MLRRINDEEVKAIPLLVEKDTRPVKGSKLFPEIYANICLCARKKSGKTSVLAKIIKECVGKNTTIIVFCSTLHKDANWLSIQKYCEVHKINFIGYTSLVEGNVNHLQDFVDVETAKAKARFLAESTASEPKPVEIVKFEIELGEGGEPSKKEKRSKFQSPEYIIIFDDLSGEIKNNSLIELLKKNRHFYAKVIVSSQYLNDLKPESRKMMDYLLVFKGQPEKKLDEIHRDFDISIPPEQFYDIYKIATEADYSFLYVDRHENSFRSNFTHEFDL